MPLDILSRVRSVAVVGASRSKGKAGNVILKNFLRGFKGRIYPVNPYADEIYGLRCYPSLDRIPYPVDMAIIVLPSRYIPETLHQAVEKGVKISVIMGRVDEEDYEEILRLVSETSMRILGPESIGIYMPGRGLNTIFLDPLRQGYPPRGPIGILTQSGAVGTQILDILSESGIGVSTFIGLGREIDITLLESLSSLARDDETEVIITYLEGVDEGREFYSLSRRITLDKPILAIIGGVEPEGSRYVLSHTGRVGGGRLVKGVLRQAGIIELRDLDMIGEAIHHLLHQPLPNGSRIGVVTGSGGYGISLIDKAYEEGMEITSYIDVGGTAGDEDYIEALKKVYVDEEVDVVVGIPYYASPSITENLHTMMIELISEMWGSGFYKPLSILTYPYGYTYRMSMRLSSYGIPVSYSPSSLVYLIKSLHRYKLYLERMDAYKKWVRRRSYSI